MNHALEWWFNTSKLLWNDDLMHPTQMQNGSNDALKRTNSKPYSQETRHFCQENRILRGFQYLRRQSVDDNKWENWRISYLWTFQFFFLSLIKSLNLKRCMGWLWTFQINAIFTPYCLCSSHVTWHQKNK